MGMFDDKVLDHFVQFDQSTPLEQAKSAVLALVAGLEARLGTQGVTKTLTWTTENVCEVILTKKGIKPVTGSFTIKADRVVIHARIPYLVTLKVSVANMQQYLDGGGKQQLWTALAAARKA